jgi:hypothetical protein
MIPTRQTNCPPEEVKRTGGRKRAPRVGAGLALPNPFPARLAHGERSHAAHDPRGLRGYFLCALPRTSFRAPAAVIIFRNAELRSLCASLPVR